jgi:hypothetical protein
VADPLSLRTVAITEQELTQRDNVGVSQLSAWPLQLLLPIDLRLAYPIGRPKRLVPVELLVPSEAIPSNASLQL